MSPKLVLVTGGTGFIGQNLLTHLRENLTQYTPHALTRRKTTTLENILDYPTSETVIHTTDFGAPFTLPITPSVVVHCAGVMDFFPRSQQVLDQNLVITKNLLDACVAKKSRIRFVYVSTAEVIGVSDGGDENAPLRPGNEYAKSKLRTEKLVNEYADKLEIVIARPTGVYGPGERFFFHEFMTMVSTGLCLLAPSPLSGRVVFTHVEDVINSLMTLSTHPSARGIYNICADQPASFRDIVNTISDTIRVPRPRVFLPTKVGEVLMRCIAPLMNLRKRRVFVYHPRTVRESVQDRVYSNARIKTLGLRPKYGVLQGVEETVRYEMASGGLVRGPLPAALMKGLQLCSVVAFAVGRWTLGKRNVAR